jgi:hypothetical protein
MSASAARSFFLAADAFRINDFVAPHQNLSKIFRQGLAASEQINDENALSARYGDSGIMVPDAAMGNSDPNRYYIVDEESSNQSRRP